MDSENHTGKNGKQFYTHKVAAPRSLFWISDEAFCENS